MKQVYGLLTLNFFSFFNRFLLFRLPKKEQQMLFAKLVNDPSFREDMIDIAILEQRKDESSKSLNQFLAEQA